MTAHHDGSPLYVPDQAPALGSTVTVFVRTPRSVRSVHVRSTPDGEPHFAAATVDRERAGVRWWRADVEVRNPVTGYRFLLDRERWLNGLGEVAHDVPDCFDFRLVTHAPAPSWAVEGVVYEIFPDRFARSGATRELPDWAVPCDWDTPVVGSGPETPYQFYGGDLDGVVSRLDHIAGLGVDTVYLTPIFPARSNHRYDAASFDRVDPLLGGDEALKRLSAAVHERGLRLVGDLTTNHCGDAHPWFTGGERDLFYVDGDRYESWCGVPSLPKLNWGSAELRRRFFDGPSAIATRWLEWFDGWRVDVANMTGRRGADDHAHEVARLFRAAMPPDALLVAELAHDGTADLDTGGWQGAMNYSGFLRPLWTWLRRPELGLPTFLGVPGGVPSRPGPAAVRAMRSFGALVSWQARVASWNLLGSHDTARIRTVVGADRQELAAALLFTMPGTPMVFAGDEFGLDGVNGEDARRPMPWGAPVLGCYRELIALRRAHPALRNGGLRWLRVDDDVLVYARETAGESVLVAARRDGSPPPLVPGQPVYEGSGVRVSLV